MTRILFFTVIFFIIGCNMKIENQSSKIQKQPTKKENKKKLSGKEIVVELEKLGFFNLTDDSELEEAKEDIENAYNDFNFFEGKLRGETLQFIDNRFYFVDCEELFEVGGLTEYLKIVKPTFDKLNLKLEYENEQSDQKENYWNHTIEVNGKKYVAYEGELNKYNTWGIAFVKFIEMLNDQLEIQNSPERFYPIDCGEDGKMVLLTKKQFDFVKSNYPNDKNIPKSIAFWKRDNL